MTEEALKQVARIFRIPQGDLNIRPFGNGHINGTWLVEPVDRASGWDRPGARYILQTVNTVVFTKPVEVMENILAVTNHLRRKILAAGGDPLRETLNLIPLAAVSEKTNQTTDRLCTSTACSGLEQESSADVQDPCSNYYFCDAQGRFWRMFLCIEGASSLEQVEHPSDFYESGVAFGRFQRMLADFPMDRLHETIPAFHNTKIRYETLCRAIREDVAGRAGTVPEEIRFGLDHKKLACFFQDLKGADALPLRVTHNDTKLNNVMMDNKTHKGICVIDLDTVMPGLAAFDFGDAVRFGANTAAEDEKDLSRVSLNMELYEAYRDGFLEGCGGALSPREIELLPMGAMEMTYENGIRFLTDYLQGDVYFHTAYPTHNLDRARCQFALLSDMERKL